MGDARQEELSPRVTKARERAARERQERLELAEKELQKLRQRKVGEEAKEQARVSETDPEARVMKQAEGGFAPSYNVQISTDAAHGIIVGVGMSQSSSAQGELGPAVDKVEKNMEQQPQQAVVDGGFTSRETILDMADRGVDLIGSLGDNSGKAEAQFKRRGVDLAFRPEAFTYHPDSNTYTCPAHAVLVPQGRDKRPGLIYHQYRAAAAECAACMFKSKCCPQNVGGRMVVREEEAPAVVAFRTKMATEEAKQIYRQRGAVAEFPHAWIKDKIALRQFHVRGLPKVTMEAVWACLTYNIKQWIRLRWRNPAALQTA